MEVQLKIYQILLAGTYYLQVSDSNSCILLDTFVITEFHLSSMLYLQPQTPHNGFSDGKVSLTISGGTPGYLEDWGTNNPNSLFAGTHNYTITDSNSCVYTNSVLINEPNIISTVHNITNVSCNGFSDGKCFTNNFWRYTWIPQRTGEPIIQTHYR